MQNKIIITDQDLHIEDIKLVLDGPVSVEISDLSIEAVNKSHNYLLKSIKKNNPIYGVNTGFGKFADVTIEEDKINLLQKNLVLSHCVGVGEFLDLSITRLIILLKIKSLSQGYSGISLETLHSLVNLLNKDILPLIPKKGSVGASGDLAPLAHMSSLLLGYGKAIINEKVVDAKEALELAVIKPINLKAKEGLALLNGTQASTAISLSALLKAKSLFNVALIAGSMSVDAVKGSKNPFNDKIHRIRKSKTQQYVAGCITKLLDGSEIMMSHENCGKVQDPYSLRCQPQVMGACLEQISNAEKTLITEANAVTDNPLIFPDEDKILSGGNFHAEPVAFASDNLALAIAEIGSLSERRISLLMDNNLSGLPAFLVNEGGINSGFMIAQVTTAALTSENKQLATPSSVDSIPTSANQEDHVSMATYAGNRLHIMLDNLSNILAIELLASAQGIEFEKSYKTSKILQKVIDKIRKYSLFLDNDRYLKDDIDKIRDLLQSEKIFDEEIREIFHIY